MAPKAKPKYLLRLPFIQEYTPPSAFRQWLASRLTTGPRNVRRGAGVYFRAQEAGTYGLRETESKTIPQQERGGGWFGRGRPPAGEGADTRDAREENRRVDRIRRPIAFYSVGTHASRGAAFARRIWADVSRIDSA